MGCHKIEGEFGHAIITIANIYEYKGYVFEFHKWCGPTPYKKDLSEPRKTIPAGFWDMISEFVKLTDEEKEKYQIMG